MLLRWRFKRLIEDYSKRLVGQIIVVQPGLSPSHDMKAEVAEVLAEAQHYVKSSGNVEKNQLLGQRLIEESITQ